MPHLKLFPLTLLLALSACTSYQSRPLPEGPGLAMTVPRLTIDKAALRLPGMQPQAFDPSDGLDELEVALLAVANNPQLKVERARVGIGQAQLFAVELLPDPELGLELEHPTDSDPQLSNALGVSLSYPVAELVARSAKRDAATARIQQLDLELVWQEWQVAQQARMLYVRHIEQDGRLEILQEYQRRLEERYASTQRLVQTGDSTLSVAATDLAVQLSVNTDVNVLKRDINGTRDTLLGLLGLDSQVTLRFAEHNPSENATEVDIDEVGMDAVLATLPDRRPDLLALKSGYESQDAQLRKAILEQFPGIGVGLNRGRDTDGLDTVGIGVSLRLPFFSGNRGTIEVEEATREHLWYAYQARLAEAHREIHQLWNERLLLKSQLEQIRNKLPELEQMVIATRKAFDRGNLDNLTYLAIEKSLLEKRLESMQLDENLQELRIGLQTFVGLEANKFAAQVQ